MNILRYTLVHMIRSKKNTLISLLVYLVIFVLLMSFQQMMFSRQDTLQRMLDTLQVQGVVSHPGGEKPDDLNMPEKSYQAFLPDGQYAPYLSEVRLRSAHSFTLDDINGSLVAITDENADYITRYHPIEYTDCIENVWMSEEYVCVLTMDLMSKTHTDEHGNAWIDINGMFESNESGPEAFNASSGTWTSAALGIKTAVPLSLRVIGTVTGEKTIFCPFRYLQTVKAENSNMVLRANALSFIVRDNDQLPLLRDMLSESFIAVDHVNTSASQTYAVLLQDAQFLQLTNEANRSLQMMLFLRPILYFAAMGAGIMLVMMQMRSRKKELASIRSMGASAFHAALCCLLEYLLICLPVNLAACLIVSSVLSIFGLYIGIAFMLGAAISILVFAHTPLARQIRELEE